MGQQGNKVVKPIFGERGGEEKDTGTKDIDPQKRADSLLDLKASQLDGKHKGLAKLGFKREGAVVELQLMGDKGSCRFRGRLLGKKVRQQMTEEAEFFGMGGQVSNVMKLAEAVEGAASAWVKSKTPSTEPVETPLNALDFNLFDLLLRMNGAMEGAGHTWTNDTDTPIQPPEQSEQEGPATLVANFGMLMALHALGGGNDKSSSDKKPTGGPLQQMMNKKF